MLVLSIKYKGEEVEGAAGVLSIKYKVEELVEGAAGVLLLGEMKLYCILHTAYCILYTVY